MIGLVSDGFLHAAELIAIVAAFFLYSDLRKRRTLVPLWGWAGGFMGAGVFQVFDGIVDHKLLRLHQIRYGVENLLVYDLAWIGFGLVLIVIGVLLRRRARRQADAGGGTG